jgi:hypothetical protein
MRSVKCKKIVIPGCAGPLEEHGSVKKDRQLLKWRQVVTFRFASHEP